MKKLVDLVSELVDADAQLVTAGISRLTPEGLRRAALNALTRSLDRDSADHALALLLYARRVGGQPIEFHESPPPAAKLPVTEFQNEAQRAVDILVTNKGVCERYIGALEDLFKKVSPELSGADYNAFIMAVDAACDTLGEHPAFAERLLPMLEVPPWAFVRRRQVSEWDRTDPEAYDAQLLWAATIRATNSHKYVNPYLSSR